MKELAIPYVFDVIFRFLNARIKDKVFGGIFRTYFDIYDKNGLAEDYTANKLISGKKGIPAELRDFYMEEENLSSLVDDISENLLPYISQKFRMCDEFKETAESSLLNPKDADLLIKFYPETENDIALFIAKVILFAMNNKFIDNSGSPDISQRIILPNISPCKYFSGREKELSALDEMLKAHDKVFVYGIGGIGKSEFVKKYISLHKKDFRNILYITYADSIKSTVAGINFLTDKKEDTISQLYTDHLNYLRLLKNDTLIVIDNFDILPETDENLDSLLELDAKILFTTRNNFGEDYNVFELGDVDHAVLFEIAEKLKLTDVEHDTLDRIFSAVHNHTLACELIIRLLKKSVHSADEILEMLCTEHINISADDKIRRNMVTASAKYSEHIRQLFRLFALTEVQQEMMRLLSLVPVAGIRDRYFSMLTGKTDFTAISELDEMGLVHYDEHIISVHPLVGEAAAFDMAPDMSNCHNFIDALNMEFQHHLCDPINYMRQEVILEIADRIIEFAKKNDIEFYFDFLINACPYAETFEDKNRMERYISEMEKYLPDINDNASKAVYLTCKSAYAMFLQNDIDTAIDFQMKALELLPDRPNSQREISLCFNIYNSLGFCFIQKKDIPRAELSLAQAKAICERFSIPVEEFPALIANMRALENEKRSFI